MGNPVDEQLIAKYFEGRCTPEETALVEEWLWNDYQEATGKMPHEAIVSLKEKLNDQIMPGEIAPRIPIKRRRHYMAAAAAILIVLTAASLLWQYRRRETTTASEVVYRDSIYNTGNQPYKTILADGSAVWLNAGAVVYIAADFNKTERRVKVTGEAFFNIRQDAARPFYTEAGDLTTQVLGTSYDIEAFPAEKEIRVSLLRGKVAVHARDTTYTLSPGQAVVYGSQTGSLSVRKTSIANPAAWINGKIVLNGIALPEALERLSRLYHTPLQYNEGLIKDKYITGEFDRDTLPAVLESVLFVHNLKFIRTTNGGYSIY